MKKVLLIILAGIMLLSLFQYGGVTADCSWDGWDIAGNIDNCVEGTKLVQTSWSLNVTEWGGFQEKINGIIASISQVILLLAVGSLVYAWYLMVFSAWEEENIKKWKDLIKWTLIGFIGLMLASTIVYLVVNLVYSLA